MYVFQSTVESLVYIHFVGVLKSALFLFQNIILVFILIVLKSHSLVIEIYHTSFTREDSTNAALRFNVVPFLVPAHLFRLLVDLS